jgi:hypothetical protein
MAPEVGLEPTTLRLTAECSAIELLRSVHGTQWGSAMRFISYNKCGEAGQRIRRRFDGTFVASAVVAATYESLGVEQDGDVVAGERAGGVGVGACAYDGLVVTS